MNRWARYGAGLAVLLACAAPLLLAAESAEEQKLIAVLQSNAGVNQKDAACKRLKHIATARSVPALAALLTDKDLAHAARYALESVPGPEAGEALCRALPKVSGRIRAGLVDSIGDRGDRKAVATVAGLLGDADPATADSAARALGRITGDEATRALKAVLAKAPKASQGLCDALLLCADRFRADGKPKQAGSTYQSLYAPKFPRHIRTAAFRGMVLSAGAGGAELAAKALTGDDPAGRLAAMGLVHELPGLAATKTFAALLPNAKPAIQVAILDGLAQRNDPAATAAVVSAAKAPTGAVRVAALNALGTLGDASCAPMLAEAAASSDGAEQRTARQALLLLRRGKVAEAILAALPKAKPPVQAEMVRALGYRRDPQVVPALMAMAKDTDASVQAASIRAIALLADDRVAGELIALLVAADNSAVREALERAIVTVCGRAKQPKAAAAAILAAMKDASVPARCSLLRAAGQVGGPDALKALRAGLADQDASLRDAALRTMADAAGLEAANDLLGLARGGSTAVERVLALRGYWRLVGLAGAKPTAERLAMCQAGLALSKRPVEKKLGLSELSQVPHLDALKLAESLAKGLGVDAEAETACVQIASSISGSHPAEAKAVLSRIRDHSKNPAAADRARKALDAMDRYVGYITTWLSAGPYRQQGKQCQQLFDVPFAPEKPGAKVAWKPLAPPSDPALFWQADLGPIVGGNHCIAYLRARVWSPKAQRVRLDMGADDGIKVWIGGKCVHANNAVRALTPEQDHAQANLRKGWNDFLVKVSQHTAGCGACVRIRDDRGGIIDGLRFDAGTASSP